MRLLLATGFFLSVSGAVPAGPLVYEGSSGAGQGKHLVFIASDHEYKSEETLPALARILARHHGFKCSVLFGVNGKGEIVPGASNVPGMEALKSALGEAQTALGAAVQDVRTAREQASAKERRRAADDALHKETEKKAAIPIIKGKT